MSLPSALESSIEGLYAAFSRQPFPVGIAERSPHAGISDADVAKLRSRPLRELATSDLARYARSAMTTWGGIEEFKYFMPRIFELFVRRPGSFDALVFEKLDAAEWRSWPQLQQDAISKYLDALWRWALTAGPDVIDAGEILRGIGLAGCDLPPWLDAWRADRSLAATEQIAHLICLEGNSLAAGKLSSYWHPKDQQAVLAFLGEDEVRARIEAALVESSGRSDNTRLFTAAAILTATPR